MLSIVIPVFKSSQTLLRTLLSIDSSSIGSHLETEVIVVLDGPDSKCEEIFNLWRESSSLSSYLVSKPHSGVSASRNVGAKLSSGKIVTFLDADDEITSNRIDAARNLPSNQILVGKQELSKDFSQPNMSVQAEKNLAPSDFHIITLLVDRKRFLEMGGFDDDFSLGSDWEFIVRANKLGFEIVYSDESFVIRHLHSENASHNHELLKHEYLAAVRKHLKKD
jgi:glycosyltransferase involved in cell wall biosynthesis